MPVNAKVEKDRKRLRELKRKAAIEMIGKASYDNVFESIEEEDFENRKKSATSQTIKSTS